MDNGNTVYINYNVTPTASWGCGSLVASESYNWAMLKTKGQFLSLRGPTGYLMNKAIDYANDNKLDINYIDLQIPSEVSLSLGDGKVSNSINLSPLDKAYANFYKCHKINPDHKISATRDLDIGISSSK